MNLSAPTLSSFLYLAACGSATEHASPPSGEFAFVAAPSSPLAVGSNVTRPAVGDFDRDGVLDIALTCGFRPGSEFANQHDDLMILLGDGHGAFRIGAKYPVARGAGDTTAADIDGDGALDLAVGQHDSYAIEMFLGDGHGEFHRSSETPQCGFGPKAHTHELALNDIDGDGDVDLLACNADDSAIGLLLNDGAGHFTAADRAGIRAGNHPYDSLSFARIDGDSHVDIVVPDLKGDAIVVLLGDGHGKFAPAPKSPFAVATRPGCARTGDVDGDGDIDIVATHDDDPLVDALLGDGHGDFRAASNSPLHLAHTVWGIALGDLDHDGDADVCLGSFSSNKLHIFLGAPDGVLREAACSPLVSGEHCGYVALADFDGDQRLDIAATDDARGELRVFLQRPAAK
jgi:hypothetical protein